MNNVSYGKILILGLFLLVYSARSQQPPLSGQIRLTLQEAEKAFVEKNLSVLASKYGIEAAKSAVKQAGLWNNPNISVEQNIYNQYTHKILDFTATGNSEVQLQQLFLLAGKRSKQVKLAEINVKTNELNLLDLLRNIKSQLRSDLITNYYLNESLKFYDKTIPNLNKTIQSAEKSYEKKMILLSELLRLKALLFTLENERLNIVNQISLVQSDIRLILNDSANSSNIYVPVIDTGLVSSFNPGEIAIGELIKSAYESRPDIMIAENNKKYEEANLSLQKSLAVPDLTVGGRWSRAGSYIPDYWAVNFGIDLPVFNRNQGNIEMSQTNIKADELNLRQIKKQVEKDVVVAYNKASELDKFYKNFDKNFTFMYNDLVEGMNDNYEKRNVTIIEYTDFYESYRTSMLQLNQLMSDRANALENLNLVTGKTIFNP